ncbi:MAG: hypothetical protein ACK496_03075 [Acidobacteriota bacterium]|jgi:hypothetical protein
MRRTEKGIDVAGLLLELERIGVHWRRSSGGCWLLAGGPVPGWLLDALSGVDHRRLIAAIEEFVHRREGVA